MKKYKLYCDEVLKKTICDSKEESLKLDFVITLTSGTLFISNTIVDNICDLNNILSGVVGTVFTGLLAVSGIKTYIDLDKKNKALSKLGDISYDFEKYNLYVDFDNTDIMDEKGIGVFYGDTCKYNYALIDKNREYSILADNKKIIYKDKDNSFDITDVVMCRCLSHRKYKKHCEFKNEEI